MENAGQETRCLLRSWDFYQLTMADYAGDGVPNGRTSLADYPFPG